MNFQAFTQELQHRLAQQLPGEEVQFKMAPARRLTYREYYEQGMKNAKQSAVLVCLYSVENKINVALMLRPTEPGVHSDQVSFPGGRFEESDESLEATALREAHEEVGIESSTLSVLGKLTPLYIPVSNYMVHPFVAVTNSRPKFSLNQNEVKQIIETDVTIFLKEEIRNDGVFLSGSNQNIEAPYYEVQGHKIWGATAMIISELNDILRPILTIE